MLKTLANVWHTTYTGAVLTALYKIIEEDETLQKLNDDIQQEFKQDFYIVNPKDYGDYLKNARLFSGISQEELAKRVGLKSRSTIHKYETNKIRMTSTRIVEVAKALNVTPDYLMGWEGPFPNSTQINKQ